MSDSMGKKFRELVHNESPLQIPGTINAYSALLAESAGARALYLSGGGVANASYGLPDLGITNLNDVLEDARRITDRSTLPLLVDVDTGFGNEFGIARTVKLMQRAGVGAIHIEDQHVDKRCGHRPDKKIIPVHEMVDRIKAAVDARNGNDFVIMARTDALANEGMDATIDRVINYIEAGADMIFPEAFTTLEEYQYFCQTIKVAVLANITEFGKTPLFTKEELKNSGIKMILYPLSAFRAMSFAALKVYKSIFEKGTQKEVIDIMQTRTDLYDILDYYTFEVKQDQLLEDGDD